MVSHKPWKVRAKSQDPAYMGRQNLRSHQGLWGGGLNARAN